MKYVHPWGKRRSESNLDGNKWITLDETWQTQRREQQKSQADKKDKQNGEGDAGGG